MGVCATTASNLDFMRLYHRRGYLYHKGNLMNKVGSYGCYDAESWGH